MPRRPRAGRTPEAPCTAAFAAPPSAAIAVAVAATLAAAPPASAQAPPRAPRELSAEVFAGTAWSLPTPLVVRLRDRAPARLRARWATRPFADAPYYAWRVGAGRGGHAGEAELVHHKLYLTDPAPPVERLEVTHGYNLAMGNFRGPAGAAQVRVGLGVVVTHAEGRIAGAEVPRGYRVAGLTAQLAVGRRYALGRGRTVAFAAPEAKLTASLARVPLEGGSLLVPNVAVHALAGLGVRARR